MIVASSTSDKQESSTQKQRDPFATGQRVVTQRVTENPLLALFMAGVAGYALAWLIHGKK